MLTLFYAQPQIFSCFFSCFGPEIFSRFFQNQTCFNNKARRLRKSQLKTVDSFFLKRFSQRFFLSGFSRHDSTTLIQMDSNYVLFISMLSATAEEWPSERKQNFYFRWYSCCFILNENGILQAFFFKRMSRVCAIDDLLRFTLKSRNVSRLRRRKRTELGDTGNKTCIHLLPVELCRLFGVAMINAIRSKDISSRNRNIGILLDRTMQIASIFAEGFETVTRAYNLM